MKLVLSLAAAAILLSACLHQHRDGPIRDAELGKDPPLPADYFDQRDACIAGWSELLAEWKANGGGEATTLAEVRKAIKLDTKSRFSRFIREVWSSQEKLNQVVSTEFGSWPVSERQFKSVSALFHTLDGSGLPDCIVPSVPLSIWGDDLRTAVQRAERKRFAELPESVDPASGEFKDWLYYWVLVRVD